MSEFSVPLAPVARPSVTPAFAAALLLLAAFFWGAGNVANKTVLHHIGPVTAVALRCAIAVLVVLPLAMAERRRHPPPHPSLRGAPPWSAAWVPGAVGVSLLFAAALALQQMAYLTTSVTNASFLVNTAAILTPVLVWAIHGERPGLRVAIAAPLTLVGAFLMTGATFRLSALNPGDLVCLGSATVYALWMVVLGRHAAAHRRPFSTMFLQFGIAAAVLAPLALLTEGVARADALAAALPELLVLGVFSTAAAFGLMTYAQRFVAASTAAILVSAESLFGAAGAVLLLSEAPPMVAWTGAALIFVAIALVAAGGAQDGHTPHSPPDRPTGNGPMSRVRPVRH